MKGNKFIDTFLNKYKSLKLLDEDRINQLNIQNLLFDGKVAIIPTNKDEIKTVSLEDCCKYIIYMCLKNKPDKLMSEYMDIVNVYGFDSVLHESKRQLQHMLIIDRQKEIVSEMIDDIHEQLYNESYIPIFDKVASAEIFAFLSGKFKIDDDRELKTIQDHIAKYAKYNSHIFNDDFD